jgi:hypothetical protein
LKRIILLILALSTITVSLNKVLLWSLLDANRDFITEKYCVNKSNPSMHCEGSCFIAKKMQETASTDNILGFFLQDFSEIVSVLPQLFSFNFILEPLKTNFYKGFSFNYSLLFSSSLFHPPLL